MLLKTTGIAVICGMGRCNKRFHVFVFKIRVTFFLFFSERFYIYDENYVQVAMKN